MDRWEEDDDGRALVAERFGRNLRRARRRAGLSQEELAALASVHRTGIGLWEHGRRVAGIDSLVRLSGSLSVAPEELLDGILWVPGGGSNGSFAFDGPVPGRRRVRRDA